MRKKLRFRWRERQERSMHEIVSEDGVFRTKEILFVIQKLCLFFRDQIREAENGERIFIHPKNVFITIDGNVRIANQNLHLSAVGPYLAPEFDRNDTCVSERVYALGMLMLFMATGTEKRADAEAVIGDRSLIFLIEKCTAFDPSERFADTDQLLEAVRKEGRTEKKALSVILLTVCVCLFVGFFFFFWKEGKLHGRTVGEESGYGTGYAIGYEQGFSDARGIGIRGASFDAENGNLSGNLAEEGGAMAAYSEESVFFYQDGTIWRMDPYTEEAQILTKASEAYGLLYYNDWLYYCTKGKVLRINPETKDEEIFCDSHTGQLYIFESTIYLYDNTGTGYLYRVDPVKKTLTQLNGAMKYLSLNIVEDTLYYIASDRENRIYSSDLDGGNDTLISSNSYESFCIYGGKLYAGTEDGLIRMDLNGGNPERLTSFSAYHPNVSDGGIFYLSGSGKSLEWMSFDGKTRYTIVSTRTGSFNIAGQWIFYRNEEDGGNLWRIRVSGSDNARITK